MYESGNFEVNEQRLLKPFNVENKIKPALNCNDYTKAKAYQRRQVMKKALFLILYLLSPLLPIAAIYLSNPGYFGAAGLVPMLFGAISFTWLNAQLIISARPKLIESVFGLDRIYRFHSLVPVIALSSVLVHKLIKEKVFGESFKTQLGDAAFIIFIICSVLGVVFLSEMLVQKSKYLMLLRKLAIKFSIGKYNIQRILHNLTVAAVILVFIHVMLSNSARNVFVKAIFIAYFTVAMGFYLYHKIIMRYFLCKKFVVESVTEESLSMQTITLKPVNGEVFRYRPGQFGFIRIYSEGVSGEEHPFSITSEPSNKETLTMTIKSLGDWTLNVSKIKSGSKALLTGPFGKLSPLLYPSDQEVVLIAGGVGITPMISILRYFENNEKDRKVILFWGVKDQRELIWKDEFVQFGRDMKNFTLIPVMSGEDNYMGEKGYINTELLERVMKSNKFTFDTAQYYICGPGVMQTKIIKGLKVKGIRSKNIHYESFSL